MLSEKLRSPALLPNEWSLWIDKSEKGMTEEEYLSGLKCLYQFKSLNEMNNKWKEHKLTDRLAVNVNIRIFQTGVQPVWETNDTGGKWLLSFIGVGETEALQKWISMVRGLCTRRYSGGGPNDHGDAVVGAVFSQRTWGTMISVWSSRCDPDHVHRVRRKLRKCFDLPRIKFQSHTASVESNKEARSTGGGAGGAAVQANASAKANAKGKDLKERRADERKMREVTAEMPSMLDFRVLALCFAFVIAVTAIVKAAVS